VGTYQKVPVAFLTIILVLHRKEYPVRIEQGESSCTPIENNNINY
jgi:hypothetical protein